MLNANNLVFNFDQNVYDAGKNKLRRKLESTTDALSWATSKWQPKMNENDQRLEIKSANEYYDALFFFFIFLKLFSGAANEQ